MTHTIIRDFKNHGGFFSKKLFPPSISDVDNHPWFDDELRKLTNERNRIHSFAYDFPASESIWDRL